MAYRTIYATTITSSGQITLPKDIRDFYKVNAGDRVNIVFDGKTASIEKRLSGEEIAERLDAMKSDSTRRKINEHSGEPIPELSKIPKYRKRIKEEYGL